MILVDTSVWIDAFNGKPLRQVEKLTEILAGDADVCTMHTIVQEVLQGIRNDSDFENIKYRFEGFPFLTLDLREAAIGAAKIYRDLRKKGVSIRKPNDCLIAHYAISYKLKLLHNDADFDQIARHTSLLVFKA